MTAISITPGYPTFADTDGSPLNDGYVYIGLEYQDPITAPTTAFWDKDFRIPADQPLRTSGGYVVRDGSPAAVYTGAAYSILVQNKNLVTVYNAPSAVITNVTNNVEEITQYQGAHATDPVARNDGTPLQTGDLYFNTVVNELKVWTGTVWVPAVPGTVSVENFTGTGAQTAFNLATAPVAENNTQIYIDGVYQQKDTYTVSGATINFSTAPPNLSGIEVVTFSIASLGTVDASNVSYNEGSAGAVNRSVQSKLQESVSIQDFGASPSNSASVNTAAIQAAIDSVGAHGHVYIPSGTYDIDGTIIVKNAYTGIHITCDGKMNYVGTTVAWQIGEPGGKLWEPNFKGLYVTRAYTTPFETGLKYTAFKFVAVGEGVFDDLRCQGFRYGYSLVATQSSVSLNTFNSISSQDCFYCIYMNCADFDSSYTTANIFVGGYHVTNQVNFDDNVTSGAALIQMENTYRLTRSGNTVDGNRFIGGTYEQPVHRKVYCEGNSNSWSGCYFDTGSKQSGAAWYPTPPAANAYPFHQSSPVPGFSTAAGSAVLTNIGSGYNAYISVGDRIGIVAATDMSDNGDYVCVAVDANSVTVNHNLATTGTCSIVHDTANIEFTATGTNNTIIDCSDIAYQQITSVDTAKTTRVIGGQMGFTSGVMPNFGFTPSINNPFGFTDAQSKGSLGIVGTTPSGGDEGMQGYLGNINDGDLSSYTLKFVGLDANERLSAYSAIKANKEGRNTSQAFGGFIFQVRQNTTNADLVDAVEISADKSLRLSGFLAATVNSVTSGGALTTLELNNEIDTTAGAIALTLADGVVGHMLNLIMIADGGDAVITPANFGNGTTLTFNDVGDSCSLMFTSGNWWILSNNGCAIA